jgi:hypothetical protein
MTLAVTSQSCIDPPDDSCNLCGLIFSHVRAPFMPGNFWTAKCNYINQLMDPVEHQIETKNVANMVKAMRRKNELTLDLLPSNEFSLGLHRFLFEFWVGSHPSVIPCDVSSHEFQHWMGSIMYDLAEFKWSMAPRNSEIKDVFFYTQPVPCSYRQRKREYFLLPGYLI